MISRRNKAPFGVSDPFGFDVPFNARCFGGGQPRQLPGRTQEEEDADFQLKLDEKGTELDAREKELKKLFESDLERSKAKEPRREVPKVRVERGERRTGLRF